MKFESYEAGKGSFRWRLLKADGGVFEIKPGKIMGLKTSPSQKKTSERVVNEALKRLAKDGRNSAGTSNSDRDSKRTTKA